MTDSVDVVVVGAGATGGWAAQVLTERGLRVCVMDAGRLPIKEVDYQTESYWSWKHARSAVPAEFKRRQSVQSKMIMYNAANRHFFTDDTDNPYTISADKPFAWIRGRQVGGRSLLWGGQTWRMSDYEFNSPIGDQDAGWPLTYAELAPYYDRVERALRVRGERSGLLTLPDGVFDLPPPPLTFAEAAFAEFCRGQWPERPSIRIRSIDPAIKLPESDWPISSSLGSTLLHAGKTGKLAIRPDAVVHRIVPCPLDPQRRRVEFVDRKTHERSYIDAKAVVLGASSIESIRVLLNSKSELHPNGLGGSSNLLGRGVMDHWFGSVAAKLPDKWVKSSADTHPFWNGDGVYFPRFRNVGKQTESFTGAYGIWAFMGRADVVDPTINCAPNELATFIISGEQLWKSDNRVSIDEQRSDAWGIPVARVEVAYGDNEHAMATDAFRSIREMAEAVGMKILSATGPHEPGISIHEVGGAKMGKNPESSVTNSHNQLWDDPRVLVIDGACWPTAGYQNPTLTMMAIASRASEHLATSLTTGALAQR